MDFKYEEISIKEEPLDEIVIKEEPSEGMGEKFVSDFNIKTVIEIKEESFVFGMEPSINSENLNQISGINEIRKINTNTVKWEIDIKDEIKTEEEEITFEDQEVNVPPLQTHSQNLYIEDAYEGKSNTFNGNRYSQIRDQELIEEEKSTVIYKKRFSCLNCNIIFESENELVSHLKSICESSHCSCDDNCESDLKTDLLNHKSPEESILKRKLFKCSECSYECNQKGYLKQHLLKHQNLKLFKCAECNYECNYKGSLKRHLLTHGNIKLFTCSECDYECNQKGSLKIHLLTHGNVKLFRCSECNYECNYKGNLKKHLLTHGNIKLFKCSECDYECNQKGSLKSHLLRHENKIIKVFKCSDCNYECYRKGSLKRHLVGHGIQDIC